MQGSAGCSPKRPRRHHERTGRPPSFHRAPSQVQARPGWGLPRSAQVRRPQCGSVPAPGAAGSPPQAPTAAEDAEPCGRAPPGPQALSAPAAAPAGPPVPSGRRVPHRVPPRGGFQRRSGCFGPLCDAGKFLGGDVSSRSLLSPEDGKASPYPSQK